jgi:ribosome recycling factor
MFNLPAFKQNLAEKIEWLSRELQGVRTGRASPALLDSVRVEVYGSMMALQEIASISGEDARTLYVNPWDKGQVKAIEKAITLADLGVSVGSDEKGIRVSFPELTHERRAQLVKLVHAKLEDARIQVRGVRTKAMAELEKSGLSDDDVKRMKTDIQKAVDDTNHKLEELTQRKEKELGA